MNTETLIDEVTALARRILCTDCGASDACDCDVEAKCPNAFSELYAAANLGAEHMKEKALKAFCKAVCPNGIRCEKTSTPHTCKRSRRFVEELTR